MFSVTHCLCYSEGNLQTIILREEIHFADILICVHPSSLLSGIFVNKLFLELIPQNITANPFYFLYKPWYFLPWYCLGSSMVYSYTQSETSNSKLYYRKPVRCFLQAWCKCRAFGIPYSTK